MNIAELNNWYASLTTTQKEHIAADIIGENASKEQYKYPVCTNVWNTLNKEKKAKIHKRWTANISRLV